MNELNFNVFNVIILAGIIHGIIFCLVIFFNKRLKSRTNYFLALTILFLALSNLQYWLIDTNVIPRVYYEKNYIIYIPFEFLILPFFYFFVKSFILKKVYLKQVIYTLSPFIFSIVYILIRNFISGNIYLIKSFNIIVEYISIIFSFILLILIFIILLKHEKNNNIKEANQLTIKTNWLKKSLIIGLILCFLWALSFNLFENLLNKGYYKYYPLWIGMAILMYWIGYTAILQNHLYVERLSIRNKTLKNIEQKLKVENLKKQEPPKSFNLIDNLINKNKLYLNPNLNLDNLATKTGLSVGYISQLFNKHSELNFNDFINKLRIEEAKKIIIDNDFKNYTIHAISLEVGFNSKSSFYNAFKKFTGKTPIQYKKSVQNI